MSSEGSGSGSLLEEFFVRLGVKADHKALHAFEHSLGSVKHAMEAVGLYAAFELGEQLLEFVERSIGAAAAVQETAEVIEMSASSIEAFNRAAMDGGVNAQEMQGALEGVTRAAGAAAAGFPRFKALFETIGIDPKGKTTEVLFEELAKKFEKWDPGTRLAVAGRLGISPKLAKLMSEGGGEEFAEAVKKYSKTGILTDADFARAHEAEITIAKLHKTIQQVSTLIAIELTPTIQRAIDAFQEWWSVNKKETLTKLGDWIWIFVYYLGVLYTWVVKAKDGFSLLWDQLTFGLLPGFKGLVVAVMALEAIKLAVWLRNVWSAMAGMSPLLGTIALVIYGVMGLVSIAQQLKDNWGPILLWMRDMWKGITDKVKDLVASILKIPGVKKAVDWFGENVISTDQRNMGSNYLKDYDARKAAEAKALVDSRMLPDRIGPDGIGVWHIMKANSAAAGASISNVQIQNVNIQADKGREATVGEQLHRQVREAGSARNAQQPFKS